MMGIDLVLPDFAYLRERARDIEAIVVTHGHEDHLGALPWVLRELGEDNVPAVYGGPLTIAMARSKLDEHKLKRDAAGGGRARGDARPGAVLGGAGPHDPLDPRLRRRRAHLRAGHGAGDRRLQVRPDARRRQARRRRRAWPSWAARASCCCAGTRRTSTAPGSRLRSRAWGRTWRRSSPAARGGSSSPASPRTSTASSRSSTPRARSGARSRWSAARCARTSTSAASSATSRCPRASSCRPREIDDFPDDKLVIISTGSQGEPLSALRRMAHRDHPAGRAARRATRSSSRPRRSPATSARSTRRSTASTTSAATSSRPRDAPVHASGHGYAEEIKLMLNLVRPRYVMPFHGDFKRIHLHAQLAEAVGVDPDDVFKGENGLPLEIDGKGARFGKREQSGMIFVDGVDIGDPADVALRDRRMLSADGIFIVVATVSEQDGESVAPPEVIFRGVPAQDEPDAALHRRDLRASSRPRWTGPRARRSARSTCSRSSCTTTWPRSSTSACAGARWCCRSSSRSSASGEAPGLGPRRVDSAAAAGRGRQADHEARARRPRGGSRRRCRRGTRPPPGRWPGRGPTTRRCDRRRRGRSARTPGRPAPGDARPVVLHDELDLAAVRRRHGRVDASFPAACGGWRSRSGWPRGGGGRRASPSTIARPASIEIVCPAAIGSSSAAASVSTSPTSVGRSGRHAAGVGAGEQEQVGDEPAHPLSRAQGAVARRRPGRSRRAGPTTARGSRARWSAACAARARRRPRRRAGGAASPRSRARASSSAWSMPSSVRASSATSSSASGWGIRRLGSRVRSISRAAEVSSAMGRMARRATASPASRARSVPPATPRMRKKRTLRVVWRTSDSGRAYSSTAEPRGGTGITRDSTR